MAHSSLALDHDHDPEPPREPEPPPPSHRGVMAAVVLLLLAVGGLALLAYRLNQRMTAVEARTQVLVQQAEQAAALARQNAERAVAAEGAARAAARGRDSAEAESATARQEADAANQKALTASEEAARAKAEADTIRKKAEADVDRLQKALGEIAETRRTALGVILNLGEDHLKFEFNKALLHPADRELLARIAGILMTSEEYTISVNGHTDDVGSDDYNQKLSLRRAEAVRDYLVKAGLPPDILSVEGHGKSLPLVKGTTDAARAKNRRVELALVNTQIKYGKAAQ